jgi:hypothetical protein
MADLLRWMDAHAPTIILVLAVISLVSLTAAIQSTRAVRKISNRWRALLSDSDVETLGMMLQQHMEERMEMRADLRELDDRTAALETQMKSAKRYLGFHRYNAFPDVSGDQSFALAVYDELGDGVILTSQVGRESVRVYAKRLVNGEPDKELTEEEDAALQAGARRSGRR